MVITAISKTASAYRVEIFIGGDYAHALAVCQRYCNQAGLCVTVEKTCYVYTGGQCEGVRVGLINYARFPKERKEIFCTATMLAEMLLTELGQGSYTVQDDKTSLFYSTRPEDIEQCTVRP